MRSRGQSAALVHGDRDDGPAPDQAIGQSDAQAQPEAVQPGSNAAQKPKRGSNWSTGPAQSHEMSPAMPPRGSSVHLPPELNNLMVHLLRREAAQADERLLREAMERADRGEGTVVTAEMRQRLRSEIEAGTEAGEAFRRAGIAD